MGESTSFAAKCSYRERRLDDTLHWRLSSPKWKSIHPLIEVGVSELINVFSKGRNGDQKAVEFPSGVLNAGATQVQIALQKVPTRPVPSLA